MLSGGSSVLTLSLGSSLLNSGLVTRPAFHFGCPLLVPNCQGPDQADLPGTQMQISLPPTSFSCIRFVF